MTQPASIADILPSVLDRIFAGAAQSEASRWVNSDPVSVWGRESEVEDLEEQGFIIGGLS